MEKRLKQLLLILICLVSVQAFAQNRIITGQVVDESGLPIPGVSVYIKDSTIGTTAAEKLLKEKGSVREVLKNT